MEHDGFMPFHDPIFSPFEEFILEICVFPSVGPPPQSMTWLQNDNFPSMKWKQQIKKKNRQHFSAISLAQLARHEVVDEFET